MKVGDWVIHKEYGWIGHIQDNYTIAWSNMFISDNERELYRIKWHNAKKKYNGLYNALTIAPYQPDTQTPSFALGDWLSTPHEKLRNALAAKTERNELANTRRKPPRLDGR